MKNILKWAFVIGLFSSYSLAKSNASLALADQLLFWGQLDEAAEVIKSHASTSPQQPEVELLQARILIAKNKLEDAETILNKLLEIQPDNSQVHYWYGRLNANLAQQASIFKAGSYAKKSKNGFIKSIELAPNFVDGYEALIQFYVKAPAIVGGSSKKAQAVTKQLAAVDPLAALLSEFSIAREEKDEEAIRKLITQFETEYTHAARAQLAVGFYFQQAEDYDRAYTAFYHATGKDFSQIQLRDNNYAEVEAQLGAMYQLGRNAVFSGKHIEIGIAALSHYVTLDLPERLPSIPWAKYRLSKLYMMNNQVELAKPLLESINDEKYDDLVALVRKALRDIET